MSCVKKAQFFEALPDARSAECFDLLQSVGDVRIERIVSLGQVTPAGIWLDQAAAEWVLLLRGAASLEFEGEADPLDLVPGDYVFIAAHRRHRVAWTDPMQPTVWLAVHVDRPRAD